MITNTQTQSVLMSDLGRSWKRRMRSLAALLLTVFLSHPAMAAFSCTAAGTDNAGTSTISIAINNNDLIFVTTTVNESGGGCAGTTQTVTAGSNTLIQLDQVQVNTFLCVTDFYKEGASSASGVTVTLGTFKNIGISVLRCSGVKTSSALDTVAAGGGHSTANSNVAGSGTIPTGASFGASGDLFLGGAGQFDATSGWTAGTGGGASMTIPSGATQGGFNVGNDYVTSEWSTGTAAGTVSVGYSGDMGDGHAILGAAFLPAPGGGGSPTMPAAVF